MKKGYLISIVALLVALVGVVVALAAYFKRKNDAFCDEYGDDLLGSEPDDLDYYSTQVEPSCEVVEAPKEEPVEESAEVSVSEDEEPKASTEE